MVEKLLNGWTTGKINIEIIGLNNDLPVDLQIYDFTGKEVFGLYDVSERHFELDLESYKPGIYVVRVIQGDFTENKKVVKQ